MILRLHLDFELPNIGTGVRPVEVCSIGRKWAWLRKPGQYRRTKMPLAGPKGFMRVINAKNNREARETLRKEGML